MQPSNAIELPKEINPDWRIGIVHSTYHKEIIDNLTAGAKELLIEAGLPEENITFHPAPGSFELPLIGAALAETGQVDAMMAFGIIVQGDTKHADLLATEVTRGLMDIQLAQLMPFAFEVLYVNDIKQAVDRSTGENNKGKEAANAVLHALSELDRIGEMMMEVEE